MWCSQRENVSFCFNKSFLIITTCLLSSTFALPPTDKVPETLDCGEDGDCPSSPVDCQDKCGCDKSGLYHYNSNTDECIVNLKNLMLIMIEKYNSQEKISKEADTVFQGILISVILFVGCACVCVLGACFYCFRIHYTDYRLRKEVKGLAKHLGKDHRIKKPKVKKLLTPAEQNCNVLIEDGIFIV